MLLFCLLSLKDAEAILRFNIEDVFLFLQHLPTRLQSNDIPIWSSLFTRQTELGSTSNLLAIYFCFEIRVFQKHLELPIFPRAEIISFRHDEDTINEKIDKKDKNLDKRNSKQQETHPSEDRHYSNRCYAIFTVTS